MEGLVNSLRGELVGLVSISAYIICSIGLQFEHLEKLKSSSGDGFAMLGSAYKGERSVSIQEIKRELIKPIENMESKLEVKDRLTGALPNVRPALIKADLRQPTRFSTASLETQIGLRNFQMSSCMLQGLKPRH
jgi:hypothetical protein